MNTVQFVIFSVVDLLGFIFILRAWFQFSRVDFYHPLSQTLVKVTQPVLAPLRVFIPTIRNVDVAALVAAFILFTLKYPLIILLSGLSFSSENILANILLGIFELLRACGKAIIYVLLISAIMSWFNRSGNSLQYVLHQLTAPLLNPIRRILPNTGMIDFSPMILVFGLLFIDRLLSDLFPLYAYFVRLG
ncbi:YggT family protein [[Haemophilus] felis]|uniref:YggT family protein n=1 Tax=[Haemophilus] felis TaxID=123822 RepID=A0A1T0B8M9_9PAST|nr:YggT family protein [[Haemophilus] felis]NBI41214.1 YggT family protein [[Haemophilus] felis]OOS06560.1 hypothetical protein B0188_02195 [[Haemophilus] felis]